MVLRTYLPSLWEGSNIRLRQESPQKHPAQTGESECNKHGRINIRIESDSFCTQTTYFQNKGYCVILTEQEELLALQTNQCIGNC